MEVRRQDPAVRVRVRSSWRTRALILLCVVAAGVIAYLRAESRESERPPVPAPAAEPGVVDVEIVAE